ESGVAGYAAGKARRSLRRSTFGGSGDRHGAAGASGWPSGGSVLNVAIAGPETAADLRSLAQRFDVFFVDQFGVLHDGSAPYPGAVAALSSLKAAGKKIVLVSNSGKRA